MTSDECSAAWRKAYSRQALSDFVVYEHLCLIEGVPECQQLHHLQMALEKASKAFFADGDGANQWSSKVYTSHDVVSVHLFKVFSKVYLQFGASRKIEIRPDAMRLIKLFCQEIDQLAPANDRVQRPDNCEYPWMVRDSNGDVLAILSPLDHEFAPSRLLKDHGAVRAFVRVIRLRIEEMAGREDSPT
jgi:hypothetical protein